MLDAGTSVVLTPFGLPFSFLSLVGMFGHIDSRHEAAAATPGAGPPVRARSFAVLLAVGPRFVDPAWMARKR